MCQSTVNLGATAPSDEVKSQPFEPFISMAHPKFAAPLAQARTLWVTSMLRVPADRLARVTSAAALASTSFVWMPLSSPFQDRLDNPTQSLSIRWNMT